MDPASINSETFTVTGSNGIRIPGTVRYIGATFFTRDLSEGSQGEDVSALQQLLIDTGFLNFPKPTGTYGAQTREAVQSWQAKSGIKTTGIFGPISNSRWSSATFIPTNALLQNQTYVISITSSAKDWSGNAFTKPVGAFFSTDLNCRVNISAPESLSNNPTLTVQPFEVKFSQINIGVGQRCTSDRSAIVATFSHHVNPLTLTDKNVYVLGPDGLPLDGEFTFLDIHHLSQGLTIGSTGEDVKKLQLFLYTLGFLPHATPNGYFGPSTKVALTAWQKSLGIKTTGTYDSSTLNYANVLVFTPTYPLEEASVYTIIATTGIQDDFGKPLSRTFKRGFVTYPYCLAGSAGSLGQRGLQGIQGIAGIQGTRGLQSLPGIQGATGTQGTPGTPGLQGATGTQGISGERGPGGTIGATGATGASGPPAITLPHVVLIDTSDQTTTNETPTRPITFNTNVDLYQMDHSTTLNPSRIYMQSGGLYRFNLTIQVKGEGGSTNIWLRRNGIDIPYSNSFIDVGNVYISQSFVFTVRAVPGDYFEFMQGGNLPGAGIVTRPTNSTSPATPSATGMVVYIGA